MSLARAVSRRFADVHAARDLFVRKLLERARATDFTLRLFDADGRRLMRAFNSAPVRAGERVVGVFGWHEFLRLLWQGLGSRNIAASLGLSEETVRNHIRALLRALGAHSRLEALAVAPRHVLLP